MERKESQSIGDILRLAFQENCMQDRLDERRAVQIWGDVVGRQLAMQCRRPDVADGVMTVGVANAALRHELTMSRTKLLNEINRQLGKDVISNIRFVGC